MALIGLPVSFFLKNKLHLQAHEVALFGLVATASSVCVGFLLRLQPATVRNPSRAASDRGCLMLFGALGPGALHGYGLRAGQRDRLTAGRR